MSLTNDQITAKNFKEFYEAIRPYLNGSFPTAIANKFDKANMYSTDEQIVGRWIDGKPLYQKTVHITNVSSDNIELISSGVEYAKLVDVEYATGNGIIQTGNWWASASDYINLRIVRNEVGKITLIILQSRNPVSGVYVTIQYTKTTDTAMDIGSDTDYSTTEKIIGTWIDGKPLYQKTIDIGALPNNTTKQVSHGISDLKNVVGLFGYATDDSLSESNTTPLPYIGTGSTSENITVWEYDGTIRVRSGTNYSAYTGYVIIQYTKATD